MWKMSIQYMAAGIQTHNLVKMSHHPEPLDQGSRPTAVIVNKLRSMSLEKL